MQLTLAFGHTELSKADYGFLTRFLDVTKANLFFARGVLIVEGDAENILLPTLARLLRRDLTESGVSIVNVGGVGLRRFARILQRKNVAVDGEVKVPVACVTDLDVMPDCAPEIIGKVKPGETWPKGRRWRAKKDFPGDALEKRRSEIKAKASGQNVETFVADEWTLEYDLAFAGFETEVWLAAHLAKADDNIHAGKTTAAVVAKAALRSFKELNAKTLSREEMCSHIYEMFADGSSVSKAVAAQYLACILDRFVRKGIWNIATLYLCLPKYLVKAIEHVTHKPNAESAVGPK